MNINDNYLRADQVWVRERSNTKRMTLVDKDWDKIIEDKVVLSGNFNAYSLEWNLTYGTRRDVTATRDPGGHP